MFTWYFGPKSLFLVSRILLLLAPQGLLSKTADDVNIIH